MAEIQRGIARSAGRLTWVVVGDLSRVEVSVRALGLGEVIVIDSQGTPLQKREAPVAREWSELGVAIGSRSLAKLSGKKICV
jgi:hypothetical protein